MFKLPVEKSLDRDEAIQYGINIVVYELNGNQFTKYLRDEEIEELKKEGAVVLEVK